MKLRVELKRPCNLNSRSVTNFLIEITVSPPAPGLFCYLLDIFFPLRNLLNKITLEFCWFRCLSVDHAVTSERILMEFNIQTRYELPWVMRCLFHGNGPKLLVEVSMYT